MQYFGLDSYSSEQEQMVRICEYGNETSGFKNVGNSSLAGELLISETVNKHPGP
jgi:hypothetical protein